MTRRGGLPSPVFGRMEDEIERQIGGAAAGAESKTNVLNLLVSLRSYSDLWSKTLGHE